MEWYYIVLIISTCLHFVQFGLVYHFKAQKDVLSERYNVLVGRVEKIEDMRDLVMDIDAYLHYAPREDTN